jgi:hypothetical protein
MLYCICSLFIFVCQSRLLAVNTELVTVREALEDQVALLNTSTAQLQAVRTLLLLHYLL